MSTEQTDSLDRDLYDWAPVTMTDDTLQALIDAAEERGVDPEVAHEYVMAGYDLDSFSDAYSGAWGDDEEFAQDMADGIGAIPDASASWPLYCIDWERAARDLMMDYFVVDAAGETHYFRS